MKSKKYNRCLFVFWGIIVLIFAVLGYIRQTCVHSVGIISQGQASLRGLYVDDVWRNPLDFVNGQTGWVYNDTDKTERYIKH